MGNRTAKRAYVRAIVLLLLLSFATSIAVSSASAAKRRELNKPATNKGATYFVALNGDDADLGTANRPWATINHAAKKAAAGDTVVVRGGRYILSAQIRVQNSGRPHAWITFVGYPGEKAILDAELLPHSLLAPTGLDNGAFQIEGVSYIRVANLSVINSHDAGFTIRDSSNIDLINNETNGTYSSGIAVWDTNHDGKGTERIRIIGNTIIKATTWNLASRDMVRPSFAPHEALSIGGAVGFEVAYNHIYDSDKEGIDVKETSKRGRVHHNLVHDIVGQGIYVDAAFGKINDIDIFSNVIHSCGAGLIISVEGGQLAERINVRDNLIFGNKGSGLYFSRYGVDGARRDIQISNNIFYHNGYGAPRAGQTYYWMPGGLYIFSTNVRDISIRNNIFSVNRGFQIGYSELFGSNRLSLRNAARKQKIQIASNLIHGPNDTSIESGGDPPFREKIYPANGSRAFLTDPLFRDPANHDFTEGRGLPLEVTGVAAKIRAASSPSSWWKRDFPPTLVRVCSHRPNRESTAVCFRHP